MNNIKAKYLAHVISFILIVVMILSLFPSSNIYAEEDLYIAYQNTSYGTPVVKLKTPREKEQYKIEELFLNVNDKVNLCFINASFWKKPQWTSSNESIAKVDQDGVITAISSGTAVITFTYTKKISNRKISTSITIYVGEDNWKIAIGITPTLSMIDRYELKVGEDICMNIYGIPDLNNWDVYNVEWIASNKKIVDIYENTNTIRGKKAGTTTITAKITNIITGSVITRSVLLNVTNPALKSSSSWDNQYYMLYGENYKRLFSSGFLATSYEIEQDMLDTAWKHLHNKLDKIGISASLELLDFSKALSISFERILNGKNYYKDKIHLQAISYLIEALSSEKNLQKKYIKYLEKAEDIFSTIDDVNNISEIIQKIKEANLNIEKKELDSLLECIKSDIPEYISTFFSEGVTYAQYATLAACLYEMDSELLNDLQKCSSSGEALYEDIEILKNIKKNDPAKYFKQKFFNDAASHIISSIIVNMSLKNTSLLFDSINGLANMYAGTVGAPELSGLVKATYLMEYVACISHKMSALRNEIKMSFTSYSDEEVIEKIEEYETTYTIYLSMIDPVVSAVMELEQYKYDKELSKDALIPKNGYDYSRHIAMAMCAYLYKNPNADEHKK